MKLIKMKGFQGGGGNYSRLLAPVCFAVALSASAAEPKTWYVDDDNYNEAYADGAAYIAAGFDGTTTNKAFGTIQAAINASTTKAGDTIIVMPGTYDKGYYTETWSSGSISVRNRLYINKKLNIKAYGTKEETHIVGRWCPTDEGGDATYHTGPTAVRCVRVPSGGCGGTLRGFTLRDSAAISGDSSAGGRMGGAISVGAASSNDSYKDFYVIDCVISNSAALRCGAAYGGTFIRCRIHNTLAGSQGSALGKADALNCVFTKCTNNNSYYGFFYGGGSMVNCTIFGSKSSQIISASKAYNCVFTGNNTTANNVETNGVPGYMDANVFTTTGKNYVNATPDQLFAPALGDFHPVAGSTTVTMGQTKYLTTSCPFTLPDELADEMFLDFEGTPIDTNGTTVAAGAIQTPKAPKYGGILTTDDVNINGTTTYGTTVFFADEWPMCVRATKTCHRLNVTGGSRLDGIHSRFMDKSNQTWLCPPYAAGSIKTNTYVAVNTDLYVDQANGSDETGTGAQAKPFATIQKAVGKADSASAGYVIHVAEGDYDTGGAVGRGVTNRINLTDARWIRFVATGDRERTIIRGAAAKDERDPDNHPGCGPDAVRCVSTSYNTAKNPQSIAFVGFTFADGHTDVGQDADKDKGGAGFGRPNYYDALQFIDCVFTNCYAPAAGIASNASFTRCKFIDCGSGAEGFASTYLASCEVGKGSFGTGVLGASTHIAGTSIANDDAVAPGAAPTLVNSLLGDGGTVPSSVTRLWGSTANSCFADAANGDLRPVAGSPALDASRRTFPVDGDADFATFAIYMADLSGGSIDGKNWVFGGDYPIAGARMEWVPGVSIALAPSFYEFSGGKFGGNPLAEGESLTVSVARRADAARHWGVVVNGVTNMLDNGAFACTMTSSSEMTGGAFSIFGVLDQNWYVSPDPTSGASDENDGFTRDTAKLTLKGVLSVATNAGDVVHAASGTYDLETMNYSAACGDARAVVPSYVTLVADDGPENTTIKGAAGASGTYKQGEGAMRCVMLNANATVKGFTLVDGHSSVVGSSDGGSALHNGGGAWANNATYTARVIDCVISNCAAFSGGAAFGLSLFGTKMVDNTSNYSVATKCSLYGCLVGANAYNSSGLYQCYDIFDTTVEAASASNVNSVNLASYSLLRNSIVLGKVIGSTAPYNSVFCGTYEAALAENAVSCVFTDATSLGLTGYVPAARGAACETGDESLLPANATNAKLLQEMRAARPVMNGGMDAGCYEADWKRCYASDIAGKKITVTGASPNVVETEERNVRIYPGQSLAAAWNRSVGEQIMYNLNFRVVGTGTLSVVANGVETTFDTEGDHTIRLKGALADASLSFAYDGEDGYAEVLPWKSTSGVCFIIR